jgi:hypothetical protein
MTKGTLYVLLALALLCQPGLAQTVNGAFHGAATDASGAVLSDALVEVTNLGTHAVRSAKTDGVGYYTIPQLPPGHYSVTASRTGFAKVERPDVQLQVNQDLEMNFTLNPGAMNQVITVNDTPPPLETASGTIGQVVQAQQVVDLPLNGRQFTQLVLLTPGAAPVGGAQQNSFLIGIGGGGISPAVNGQRPQQNNFTLDGILNNEIFINTWSISPPPDAIQEFNVQSHIVDAQFSISSGANVNVVTKSGGNRFHGDLWEFLRNDKLDATNYFANLANKGKPPFRMNQYGLTAGGPVLLPKYDGRKRHTYLFGYWEGFRSSQAGTQFNSFPTAAQLGGDFSSLLTKTQATGPNAAGQNGPLADGSGQPILNGQIYNPYSTRPVVAGQSALMRDPFPGNIIPKSMISQQALTYLKAFYPLPNYGPGGNSYPNYVANAANVVSYDEYGIRVDQTFGNNDTLYGAYYSTNPSQVTPTTLLLGAKINTNSSKQVATGYTHLFSPTLLMSIHYGYSDSNFGSLNQPAGQAVANATNLSAILPEHSGLFLVPQITLGGQLAGTAQTSTPFGPSPKHEVNLDVQKIWGAHTISAGLMYYKVHSYDDGYSFAITFDQFPTSAIYGSNNANATGTGYGLASMLLNLPSTLNGQLGNTIADLHTTWQGYYLQDKWQLTKRLNLQFGMRYDYVAPPSWKDDEISGFDETCGCFLMSKPFPPSFPTANVRKTYFDPKYNGFQPRFGLAYSLTPSTVIRAAFGMFDDHDNNLVQLVQGIRVKSPWAAGIQQGGLNRGVPTVFFSNLPTAQSLLPAPGQPFTPQVSFSADPREKIPYSMEWNLGIQHTVTRSITAEVDYVGSGSRHLYITSISNTPLLSQMGPGPIAPKTPFPQYGQINYIQDIGNANYDSLQVKVEKRLSAGMIFLASYTWSKCLDYASTGQSAANIETIYDIRRNYGLCDFNVPQMFVGSYTYQLPFGRGRQFGKGWNRLTDTILGGWQFGGILSLHSGLPFTITVPFDNANTNGGQQRAQLVGNPTPPGFQQSISQYYSKAAFAVPAAYTFGNLGRNTLRGPRMENFDVSLNKDFHFTEARMLQVRADSFNVTNTTHFGQPGVSVGTASFMTIQSAGTARQIQVSMKFLW